MTPFDRRLLAAIVRLGRNAYGVTIRQAVAAAEGRDTAIGAVYAALERLEEQGLVDSFEGEATAGRGGRRKRYWIVTNAGKVTLERG